eukprot:TRINITY_DN14036_c0_g1_i1.p1 TRINITY_DN14036_c0_g1~~TRINITY_DN14036_c0_g1_i1.p1  ORF type:complete len:478 (-),score=116.20 TRINITY_DN14036_c0_g1_i1:498-1931(-)
MEEQYVALANNLLAACRIPAKVSTLEECNASMFVLLVENMFGTRVPGVIREPQTQNDQIANMRSLIRFIASDIVALDLSHIRAEDIVLTRSPRTIMNLIDVLRELSRIIQLRAQLQHQVHSDMQAAGAVSDEELLSSDSEPEQRTKYPSAQRPATAKRKRAVRKKRTSKKRSTEQTAASITAQPEDLPSTAQPAHQPIAGDENAPQTTETARSKRTAEEAAEQEVDQFKNIPDNVRMLAHEGVARWLKAARSEKGGVDKLLARGKEDRARRREAFMTDMQHRFRELQGEIDKEEEARRRAGANWTAYREKVELVNARKFQEDEELWRKSREVQSQEMQAQQFMRLFNHTLEQEKTRIRDERRKKKERVLAEEQRKRDIQGNLELYYRQQFDMMKEKLHGDREKRSIAQKAQKWAVERLEREIREKAKDDTNKARDRMRSSLEKRMFRETDPAFVEQELRKRQGKYSHPLEMFIRKDL